MDFQYKNPMVTLAVPCPWFDPIEDVQVSAVLHWFLQYEVQKALKLPTSNLERGFSSKNKRDDFKWCKKLFCILSYVHLNGGRYPIKSGLAARGDFDFSAKEKLKIKTLAMFNDELRKRYNKGTLEANRNAAMEGLEEAKLWTAIGKRGRPLEQDLQEQDESVSSSARATSLHDVARSSSSQSESSISSEESNKDAFQVASIAEIQAINGLRGLPTIPLEIDLAFFHDEDVILPSLPQLVQFRDRIEQVEVAGDELQLQCALFTSFSRDVYAMAVENMQQETV